MDLMEIKNFTKSESFETREEAEEFRKRYEDDSDIVHWKFSNGTEYWIVYYCSNGVWIYED